MRCFCLASLLCLIKEKEAKIWVEEIFYSLIKSKMKNFGTAYTLLGDVKFLRFLFFRPSLKKGGANSLVNRRRGQRG
jgi:hypothetical protein